MRPTVLVSLIALGCASGAPLATNDAGADSSPPGENTCGDGVQQTGETCDTGIPAGMSGACPGSCDDGDACTTDSTTGGGC